MPPFLTPTYYQSHFRPIQWAKYEAFWPFLHPQLTAHAPSSLLDLGIGPAWLESFFLEKGHSFSRIVGVDISESAISPRQDGIDYILSSSFDTPERFDLVVCFDAWHCFPDLDIQKFISPRGLLLVSEPLTYEKQLENLSGNRLIDLVVGEMEKSRVVLMKNFP
ncbi:MAG: class I SAM-dependent methyltransferase [Candidatus Diapherotrites archaeon]|nr:class I SAM-dependent methyltransferase [Candidatus Diapherotrites archaeon]MDZ4256405.1 class I SAM-dependent methyltransferase [archaeon]